MKIYRTSLTLAALFAAGLAFGNSSTPKVPAKSPCSDDIQKYCSDVTPGQGRLARCMKNHASELSSACKSYGKKYKQEHPEVEKELSQSDQKH